MSITDDRAQRVFVLEVAGLTTRYTSHPIDPSASNMDGEVADGIAYVNRASIIDVGAFAGSIDPELAQGAFGGNAVLLKVAPQRLGQPAFADFAIPELDGIVAIAVLPFALDHRARTRFEEGDLDPTSVFGEDVGHAQLLSQ